MSKRAHSNKGNKQILETGRAACGEEHNERGEGDGSKNIKYLRRWGLVCRAAAGRRHELGSGGLLVLEMPSHTLHRTLMSGCCPQDVV